MECDDLVDRATGVLRDARQVLTKLVAARDPMEADFGEACCAGWLAPELVQPFHDRRVVERILESVAGEYLRIMAVGC